MSSFLMFFATVFVFVVLFACFVFWQTKGVIETFFGGLVFPTLVICFFFLLPQTGIIVAFLATMGVLLIALAAFFFLNECSAIFRNRIEYERKMLNDVSPVWYHKKKEIENEHLGVS